MELLFSPLTVNGMTLRNRVVFPPIATNYGLRNERARRYLAERARGGAGLVLLQGTPVALLAQPGWAAGLKPLVDAVHEQGAAVGVQLWAGNELASGDRVAPVARDGHRQITAGELERLAAEFAVAAGAARGAGFDTVEVHGAHGYFLHQFFSPLTNLRTDRFGGSLEGRMSLPLECVRAIRAEVGRDFPLMYRFSAVEFCPGGIVLEDSLPFASALAVAGVDLLDVSAGGPHDPIHLTVPGPEHPLGTHADLAGAVRRAAPVPVVAVGRLHTRAICEEVLQEGKADLVAVGRQLLTDPFWPMKLQEGKEGEAIVCTACNACVASRSRNEALQCVLNPQLGQEYLQGGEVFR